MVLVLDASDLAKVLDYPTVIGAVEVAFREFGAGRVYMPPRSIINIDAANGWTAVMPAYLPGLNQLGVKVVSSFRENQERYNLPTIMGKILLLDARSGLPMALLDAGYITAVRTGATSAVATKYLARANASTLGVFGTGAQAEAHLLAMCAVRRIREVKAYDVDETRCRDFCQKMGTIAGVSVEPVDPTDACQADIVVTATTSPRPVFEGKWLRKGTHVNAIGAHRRDERELDDATVAKSKLVVDSRDAVLEEAGDVIIPIANGVIKPTSLYAELGELVTRVKIGRTNDEEITIFKAVGLALEDVATASIAYSKAMEQGIGHST